MNRIHRLLSGRERSRVVAAPALFASLLPVALAIAASVVKAQSAASAPPIPLPPAPHAPVLLAQAAPPAPTAFQQAAAAQESQLTAELETPYKKWLNQDVVYIITDEERKAFGQLTADAERDQFIEQFWLRRDPTPDTEENEYREEHYRRIAYATENFASRVPGWKTDRGMIYIKYGPPDERESHPKGGAYQRPIEEGGGQTTTFPFEKWRYRYIQGIGNNVTMEFVDTTFTGEYRMTADPAEKDALLYVPGKGLTLAEQMGLPDTVDRFTRTDGTHLGTGTLPLPASMDQFTRLEQFAKLQKPPQQPPVPPKEAVENIVFQGNQKIAADVLRNVIRTRPGDKYDKIALDHDVTMLMNTHAFENVDWKFARGQTGWIVTFVLTELPTPAQPTATAFGDLPAIQASAPKPTIAPQDAIESIVIQGTKRIPHDTVRAMILAREGAKYDRDALDRDIQTLRNTQRFSEVSWTAQRGQTGWVVTFTLAERQVPRP